MKHIFYFLITLLSFQVSQAQLITENLCELYNQTIKLSYSEIFTEEFQQAIPEIKFKEILNQLQSQNGNCESSEPAQHYFPIVSPNWYYLHFSNGRSGLFKVQIHQETSKIAGFRFVGTTLHPQKMIFKDVMMKTRDGEQLRTLSFLASVRTKKESIMARTPYFFINNEFSIGTILQASFYIEHGYHFVFQAIRGTGGSTGEAKLFNPIEAADGADLVRWIRRQSFSNGKIAAVGTSYEGLTALVSGIENPKGLKLIISGAGPVDASTGTFNVQGLLGLSGLDYFNYFTTGKGIPFTGHVLNENLTNLLFKNLDLRQYDETVFNQSIPEWDRWAEAWVRQDHEFWRSRTLLPYLKNIKAPIILTAGMHIDGNMPDTLNNFARLKSSSDHRLVLGFWDHGNNTPYSDGANMSPMIAERFFMWLDHYLKGIPQNQILNEKPILIQSHLSTEPIQLNQLSDLKTENRELLLSKASLSESSKYSYDPLEDQPQSLSFEWEADQDWAILGNIDVSIFYKVSTETSQILFSLNKINKEGQKEFLTMCTYGGQVQGSAIPLLYRNNYCPVFGKISKGEKLSLTILSNGFPVFARSTNSYSFDEVKVTDVQVFHSEQFQSKITLPLQITND